MLDEPTTRRVQEAVESFWGMRDAQTAALDDEGRAGGAARANGHLGGITRMVAEMFEEAGVMPSDIKTGGPYLPGYYRVRKQWDLVVTHQRHLVAAIEFKSQVGSVGKNMNNRMEEALGSATDTITAQSEYAPFGTVPIWLGYVFVLQETDETERVPKRNPKAIFPIDSDFKGLSYNHRYQLMLTRFLGNQIYQAGWFLTTKRASDRSVTYVEPLATACAASFTAAVRGRVDYVRAVVSREQK